MENSKLIKRNNKIKLIAFWLICVLVALFFKFSMVTPTYAYSLDSDGNLVSDNLYPFSSSPTLNNSDYIVYGADLSLTSGTYTFSFNFSGSSGASQIKFYTDDESNPVYDNVFTIVNGLNTLTFTLNSSTSKILWYSNAVGSYTNLMLNSGSTRLDYEPFGTWISQYNINYNNSLLANMGLIQYLGYMQVYNTITNEDVEINGVNEFTKQYLIDNRLISASGVLNLNYFNTSELNPNYYPYEITFYFDAQVPLNLFTLAFSTYASGTMHLYGNGNYIIQISEDTLSYDSDLIVDSPLTYIDELVIKFDSADSLSNISFNSYSIVNYNNGYNFGYNKGDNVGYQRGYNEGDNVGYQRGYNEGIHQDMETQGFRTLITTILSYPVNMVKESLNFEFMGIHVASIVLFIVSLGIVAFVIKRFKD